MSSRSTPRPFGVCGEIKVDELTDFSRLSRWSFEKNSSPELRSPPFKFAGPLDCRLVLHSRGSNYSSLYLEVLYTNIVKKGSYLAFFSFTLENSDHSKSHSRDCISRFTAKKPSQGICKFARPFALTNPDFGFIFDNSVKIIVDLRVLSEAWSITGDNSSKKCSWTLENISLFTDMLSSYQLISPAFETGDCIFRIIVRRTKDDSGDYLGLFLDSTETDISNKDLYTTCWVMFKLCIVNQESASENVYFDFYGRFGGVNKFGDYTKMGQSKHLDWPKFIGSGFLVDDSAEFVLLIKVIEERFSQSLPFHSRTEYSDERLWEIKKFATFKDTLKKRKVLGLSVESMRFEVAKQAFRLVIYPRGNLFDPSSGYTSGDTITLSAKVLLLKETFLEGNAEVEKVGFPVDMDGESFYWELENFIYFCDSSDGISKVIRSPDFIFGRQKLRMGVLCALDGTIVAYLLRDLPVVENLGDGVPLEFECKLALAAPGSKKIVGVFYKAGDYAEMNPNFVDCVERGLGLRDWLESQGHQYIVTDDKEGPDCELEKHIPDLHVLITTPFHPAYVTAERIKRAKNLRLLLTAGSGTDHIDLNAAAAAGLTVAEVTGSNVVSVAEDEVMRILILVRNFSPGYHQVTRGEWNVAAIAYNAYDLEAKTLGTVGVGRTGGLLLQRLKPFNCNLLYHDRLKMDPELENETGAKFEEDLDAMLPKCDIIVINTPLTENTKGMFDKERIAKCKKGVLIVNNASGAIMDTQAVVDGCSSGQIGGYSGDVWYPQPAPKDHPWRYMPNHTMTTHISGATIDAQLRYAAGTKDMLDRYFKGEEFPPQNYIVKEGELASQYR
ncbi:hypothetical protein RHGRI_035728 [Rhododendron griersonianum]|uniref:Formate dehydrogenase, mitochondrial n=1 Tax=Rhododendron griersonianum TaxID=479676 RepID=A0AAV6HN56_9ERIC|nr:hypothetical protein RHGRI_035728 [Rhododendron griersonianum]